MAAGLEKHQSVVHDLIDLGPEALLAPAPSHMADNTLAGESEVNMKPVDKFANLYGLARGRCWSSTSSPVSVAPSQVNPPPRLEPVTNRIHDVFVPSPKPDTNTVSNVTHGLSISADTSTLSSSTIVPMSPATTTFEPPLPETPAQVRPNDHPTEAMARLETIIADFQAVGKNNPDSEQDSSQSSEDKNLSVNSDPRPVLDEAIVELTQAEHSELMERIAELTREVMDAGLAHDILHQQLQEMAAADIDAQARLGETKFQLENAKNDQAEQRRDLRQKDIEIYRKEMEIAALKRTVDKLEVMKMECERLQAENEYLRAPKTPTAETPHANAQKPADLMAKQMLKQIQKKLVDEEAKCLELQHKIDSLEENQVSAKDLQDTKNLLRRKTSECDRLKHELKVADKRYEAAHSLLSKAGNRLDGAAYLVLPDRDVQLSKAVFPCISCFVKNMKCDIKTRCGPCVQTNATCARWRCAKKHITGTCQDPCKFEHDPQGWLLFEEKRPEW